MDEKTLKQRTAETAELYFGGLPWDRPFDLWRSFDPQLARDLSLFITGQMYAREKLPHPTRQLVAIAALTALDRPEELRLHTWAGLRVGLRADEIAEAMFQVAIYAGMPATNRGLAILREVLDARAPEEAAAGAKTETP